MTEPSLGLLSLRTQAVLYVSLILWSYRPKVYIEERLYTSPLSGSVNAKAASRGGGGGVSSKGLYSNPGLKSCP